MCRGQLKTVMPHFRPSVHTTHDAAGRESRLRLRWRGGKACHHPHDEAHQEQLRAGHPGPPNAFRYCPEAFNETGRQPRKMVTHRVRGACSLSVSH